jgi:RimJ/RimL family protein N-acetyltransferase
MVDPTLEPESHMFSDLARDDVFRIETARLWLRWPKAADAIAIQRYASPLEVSRWTTAIPHPYPIEAAQQFILRGRASNAAGASLHLVATPLRKPSQPFGGIGFDVRQRGELTLGFVFAPEQQGQGYASEAAKAMVGAAFGLTDVGRLHASVFVENVPSRRVLEKCGFVAIGLGQERSLATGKTHQTTRMALDRQDWLARRAAFSASALSATGAPVAEAQ